MIWIILGQMLRKQCSCWARLVITSHILEGITFWQPSTAQRNSPKKCWGRRQICCNDMTEICLAKSLANTLWLQLNKKKAIEIFAKKGKKKQKPFRNTASEAPRRSHGGWHSKFFSDKRCGKSRQKILDRNYRPATGRSSGFQGKNKHKGNLQHVFSTYNSNKRSEECSPMGKMLVLCKNNSKLATSRKVKAFFGSMGDTYKYLEILEIVMGEFPRHDTWVRNRLL